MKAACDKIQAGEKDSKLGCFAGQYNKYEGLTVNFDEAVHGAGGVIVGDDGKPNVDTPEATKGLQTLTDWFKDGHIPKAAITWQEEQGRQAFQNGELIFHRNWGYVYNLANKTDGSSEIAGKFAVAPLPGITGPGVSSLGGHNYAHRQERREQGHGGGLREVHVVAGDAEVERSRDLELPDSGGAVHATRIWSRSSRSCRRSSSRSRAPSHVRRPSSTVTSPWRSRMPRTGALQGQTQPDAALQALQTKLQTLIK